MEAMSFLGEIRDAYLSILMLDHDISYCRPEKISNMYLMNLRHGRMWLRLCSGAGATSIFASSSGVILVFFDPFFFPMVTE